MYFSHESSPANPGSPSPAKLAAAGRPCGFAADREPLQQLAIETNVELLRPAHALEVILILALQANLDEVLAVDRKIVVNRDAAARSERQVFALPVVLHDVQRNFECFDRRARRRKARREPRDLASHRHVAFQVSRRNRKRIREIVEAAVRGVVAGQERLHVDVEREKVANRIVVFRAIETMDGANPAGIRVGFPRAIDLAFERTRHGAIRRRIRTRTSRRRHRTGAQLRDDFFPHLGIGARRREVQAIEIEPGGVELLVVAGDAVLVEHRARGRGCRGSRSRRCLPG